MRFYRYSVLIAAVVMQLCLGATYSWSVYTESLKSLTGLGQGAVQIPFTVFYVVFPATMVFSGSLIFRLGPRFMTIFGGILFGGGWILASMGGDNFILTILGIGVLGGVGVGFAYLVPLSAGVQWFPDHKGLVTGITLAGFGGGAALMSQIAFYIMRDYQKNAFDMFFIFGFLFLAGVTISGAVIRLPELHISQTSDPLKFRSVISQKIFWLLYLTLFTGLLAGFAVNANMTKLYTGPNIKAGVTAVSVFAIANALGRVAWGSFFDSMKPTTALKLNLAAQGLLLLASHWLLQSTPTYVFFAFAAGFNYGGLLVIHATSSARFWGVRHVSQVYGWLSSANIVASISPYFAGITFDRWGNFTYYLLALSIMLLFVSYFINQKSHVFMEK